MTECPGAGWLAESPPPAVAAPATVRPRATGCVPAPAGCVGWGAAKAVRQVAGARNRPARYREGVSARVAQQAGLCVLADRQRQLQMWQQRWLPGEGAFEARPGKQKPIGTTVILSASGNVALSIPRQSRRQLRSGALKPPCVPGRPGWHIGLQCAPSPPLREAARCSSPVTPVPPTASKCAPGCR